MILALCLPLGVPYHVFSNNQLKQMGSGIFIAGGIRDSFDQEGHKNAKEF